MIDFMWQEWQLVWVLCSLFTFLGWGWAERFFGHQIKDWDRITWTWAIFGSIFFPIFYIIITLALIPMAEIWKALTKEL
ncbi:MAG: hypothetical protein KAS32_23510 [Candidatus Peribacteraceae bacterium]|nr:hypothetical protein [Candidatus Peribacteraceae bacterium]